MTYKLAYYLTVDINSVTYFVSPTGEPSNVFKESFYIESEKVANKLARKLKRVNKTFIVNRVELNDNPF